MTINVETESSYFEHGTNTDSMKNSPPEDRAKSYVSISFSFLLKSTRHFVVVVKVKYVCKIMNLMLVTL